MIRTPLRFRSRRADLIHPAALASRLQLAFELIEEAPVGALGDDLLRGRANHARLVEPQRIEPDRVLRVELAPSIVAQVSQHLERVIVVLREAALDQLPSGTLPRVTSAAWRSSVRRPSLDPEVLGRDLDRALDHPNQVGVHAVGPITRQLLRPKAIRRYPIRKVTTPVPVAGGVAGGALPMSAGSSFHGRRKPNGSACHRRTMAGVQDEAKHAISAMSPSKSWLVEKPQPNRKMLQAVLVAVFAAVLLATRLPSR